MKYVENLERVTGIEPAFSAWEADVLPLNYTRSQPLFPAFARKTTIAFIVAISATMPKCVLPSITGGLRRSKTRSATE